MTLWASPPRSGHLSVCAHTCKCVPRTELTGRVLLHLTDHRLPFSAGTLRKESWEQVTCGEASAAAVEQRMAEVPGWLSWLSFPL